MSSFGQRTRSLISAILSGLSSVPFFQLFLDCVSMVLVFAMLFTTTASVAITPQEWTAFSAPLQPSGVMRAVVPANELIHQAAASPTIPKIAQSLLKPALNRVPVRPALSAATLQESSGPAPACLYSLDPSAQRAFYVCGSSSISSSCSAVVESNATPAFYMEGTETFYLQNHAQVGVAGGWQLSGQTKLVDSTSGQQVQPVTASIPGDPLAFLPVPTEGSVVGKSHTYYDMNSRPANNTLVPGIYCGGLTVGNTNGAAFTMSPGIYVMAGGGFILNSLAVVSGSGVTVYNTSSVGWGCSQNSNYTPITISGQANVNLSAPTSGALANVVMFGDRAGCSSLGSCQDQINGGSMTKLNGALYFKSDTLLISGNYSSSGCMTAVADKIVINGDSGFSVNGCSSIGGVSVSISPLSATLYGGQTLQFSAAVSNSNNTAVSWSATAGTISASGLYTAPANITTQQTVFVTATSQADATKSASVAITLMPAVAISLSPANSSLYAGQTQQFSSTVVNTSNTSVNWSINPASAGNISATGLYTAPAAVTAQQTVIVTATSQSDLSKSASATITLTPPIAVSVSPTRAQLYAGQTQQFSAIVANTGNTAVTWSTNPSGSGTISDAGLYSAPTNISKQQAVTVTATSQADSTKSASAVVTISVPTPMIASVSPTPATADSQVTITGQNFLAYSGKVSLNGVAVAPTSWNDTSITLLVPTDNCTGPVTVTTQYGTSNAVVLPILGTEQGCMNPVPLANAGTSQTVFVGTSVQLDGSGSTSPNGTPLTYRWSLASVPAGSGASLSESNVVNPTFIVDKPGAYTAQLIVNDSYHDSAPSQVVVSTKNSAPVANAGANQTVPTHTAVQLDGSTSSDIDGDVLAYSWTFVSIPDGSQATLSDANSVHPTFATDEKGTYVVQLVVDDGSVASAAATVMISDVNTKPVANAGAARSVEIGTTVQLSGSASTDVDGDALTYRWSILTVPTGSVSALSDPTIVNPTFVADIPGTYVAQLIVNDGTVDSTPATVEITNKDVPPIANAGLGQTVAVGALVSLDGTASTASNGNPLTYLWSLLSVPTGSRAALTSTTTSNPSFTIDKYGDYVLQLIVNDGYLNSTPVTVTISTIYTPPVADPGAEQSVTVGETVNLVGASSISNDGYSLTYKWSLLSRPNGSTATLSETSSITPSFVADLPGAYVAQLIVNDNVSDSAPKTVMITAFQNFTVTISPDRDSVLVPDVARLSANVSGGVGTLQYVWEQLSGPTSGTTLENHGAATATVNFTLPGVYGFQVTVADSLGSTASAILVHPIVARQPLQGLATATPSQVIIPGTAHLAVAASDDGLSGDNLQYNWRVSMGDASKVAISDVGSSMPTVSFAVAGSYVFEVTISDSHGSLPIVRATGAVSVLAFDAGNQAPVVSAGPNQTITFPAQATLSGAVSDDGLPFGGALTAQWSKLSGPGNVVFADASSPQTTATLDSAGTYELILTATDGQVTASSTVKVTVLSAPVSPLSVNAGQNAYLNWPQNSTHLSGSVTRDGVPIQAASQWTVVSGPGEVNFDDAAILSPSATFGKPGTYVLRLSAAVGMQSGSADLIAIVGHTACSRSNQGTDFWITVPQTSHDNPETINLYFSGEVATTGTVSIPGLGYTSTFSVVPGQVTTIQLPNGAEITTNDVVEGKGVHIVSNDAIVAYLLDYVAAATDGYSALPTSVLGTDYIALSYPSQKNMEQSVWAWTVGSEFAFVATADNTTVTITPSVSAGARDGQVPYSVTLNQGQTYQLQNNLALISYPTLQTDLTGSKIHSDKPIAFFSGHVCDFVPGPTMACNHLVEQIPPVNQWGTVFAVMPLATRDSYQLRIVAAEDGTTVQINGASAATLNAGAIYEQTLSDSAFIRANKAIAVVQFGKSQGSAQFTSPGSDPTMIYVPPVDQFGGSVTIETPSSTWFPLNYVNIVTPASASGAITVDGTPLPATSFTPIQTSGMFGATLPLAAGTHSLRSNIPFLTTVYGYASYDAYGYVGGVCLANSSSGTTVTLNNHALSVSVDSQQCLTATVANQLGEPVGGAGVTFKTSGVNTASSYVLTSATGVAQFCYSGQSEGSDLVTADVIDVRDSATVTWGSSGPNQAPMVNAGQNQVLSLPTRAVTLNGSVHDDGLPNGSTLKIHWTQISGPTGVVFDAPNQAVTVAEFPSAGTYVLSLSADDGELTSSATVSVEVYAANQPPVVTVGGSVAGTRGTWIYLTGKASDDGLPLGSTLTSSWTVVSGPGTLSLASPDANGTWALFSTDGQYVVALTASDGQYQTTQTISASIAPTPVTPQCGIIPDSGYSTYAVVLNAPIPISVYTKSYSSAPVTSAKWTPEAASVIIADPNAMSTTATFTKAGEYFIEAACYGSTGGRNAAISHFSVNVQASAPPSISIALPDGADITHSTQVVGSVSSGNYTIEYAAVGSSTFTQLATGTGPISNAALATIDPTLLLNGMYTLRITAVDAQHQATAATTTFDVRGNQKLGVLTLSFADLSVPLPGLPISLVRTYDSRTRTTSGDFGYGWSLSIANARVQKQRNLGTGWYQDYQYQGYFPQYCLQATKNHFVTITFPDGKMYKFQAVPSEPCQQYAPIEVADLAFTQVQTDSTTSGAKLEIVGDSSAIVTGTVPGETELDDFEANPVNPKLFKLTTAEGYAYIVDEKLGITRLTDPNGNTLTIDASGVTHSNGERLAFHRDGQNRITSVTDVDGTSVFYNYDNVGNLIQVIDRSLQARNLAYDASHYLQSIVDEVTKVNLLSTGLDSSGRLQSMTDGNGNSTYFTYNPVANTQTIKNRVGNQTVYTYDDDGNIVQMQDALGNITSSTYDPNDNKLTETDALGKMRIYTYDAFGDRLTETDPLGHTTTYTYDAHKHLLAVTDPLNHVTTNVYDSKGNLQQTTDASGKTTEYQYYDNGLVKQVKDPMGSSTGFEYDRNGNVSKQTDALGKSTSYTYDNGGNRLSQSVIRTRYDGTKETLTTNYVYDLQNHLIQTNYPDGSTTSSTYDSLGRRISSTDGLGVITKYQYDNDGRLTETDYADGTNDRTKYDNEGRVLTRIDRVGRWTSYTVDDLGRTTRVAAPYSYGSTTAYDAVGRVASITDENGKTTSYTYDDAGRRKTVTDAMQHVTTYSYDDAGNLSSVLDARGNTVQYVYDADGRRTAVIYPDQTQDKTEYDDAGRMSAKTDQAGNRTVYGYDVLGRLTSVTDALSQVTSYAYDELGNRVSQTDANLHATTFAYDSIGRRIGRTLPAGQSEAYSYDAAGRLISHTDFNGRTTAYTYDSNGWLLSKAADPYFVQNNIGAAKISFTYYPDGKRHTMTDASGTTTYNLDERGRVTQKITAYGALFFDWQYYGLELSAVRTNSSEPQFYYGYDNLHRVTSVRDNNYHNQNATFTYDEVGNLKSMTAANGVVTTYSYDALNRLTNTTTARGTTKLASYDYLLDAAGKRTSITELSGRTVSYGYDKVNRLISEAIASDPAGKNGAVGYRYDAVGNRLQMTSTLNAIPAGVWNYDPNDRMTVQGVSDPAYDANGNTIGSAGTGNVYDFENHLVQHGGITYEYDGDGNRVSKTIGGVKTTYLVDDVANPTGYAQVVEERIKGVVQVAYGYGPMRAWAKYPAYQYGDANGQGADPARYYGYDGHGSVRVLTDEVGTVTDKYDYDAFGNIITQTSSPSGARDGWGRVVTLPVANTMLFAGEQFDPDLGLYYNRARYLDVRVGRFWGMDTYEGRADDPFSLHKYSYVINNPTNVRDVSGQTPLTDFLWLMAIQGVNVTARLFGANAHTLIQEDIRKSYPDAITEKVIPGGKIDVIIPPDQIYEIKPFGGTVDPERQINRYIAGARDSLDVDLQRGTIPLQNIIDGPMYMTQIEYMTTSPGVIEYTAFPSTKAVAGAMVAVIAVHVASLFQDLGSRLAVASATGGLY